MSYFEFIERFIDKAKNTYNEDLDSYGTVTESVISFTTEDNDKVLEDDISSYPSSDGYFKDFQRFGGDIDFVIDHADIKDVKSIDFNQYDRVFVDSNLTVGDRDLLPEFGVICLFDKNNIHGI